MNESVSTYNKKLKKSVEQFELKEGNLESFVLKHFFVTEHNMRREDAFFYPDLVCLKKYENWLNGGNKKR